MKWKGLKVVIIGMARSGVAAAKVLGQLGAVVTICDQKPSHSLTEIINDLTKTGINTVTGGYPPIIRSETDLVITSPGVPPTIPPLVQAAEEGIPLWSELELAYRLAKAPIVAITGTNGKTTTTALIGQMFKDGGREVRVGGNIGVPLCQLAVEAAPSEILIAEVSSFQLEATHQFKPRVSIILNITPDHLDRHGNFANYMEAKSRIFRQQSEEDYTVLNYDDPHTRALGERTCGRVIFFSRQEALNEGICAIGGEVKVRLQGREIGVVHIKDIAIPGNHNLENALAAVGAGWVMGLDASSLAHTLKTFSGVPHRLEFAGEYRGIRFINDSKGTNPDAAIKALESYQQPIVLIAGGRNKGGEFSSLARLIKQKVKVLVLVGEAAGQIEEAVVNEGFASFYRAATFPEAVRKAADFATPGDVVLLSPACASWDMFNNFEERGDVFKKVVREIIKESETQIS
ncbi:MAG: UDP-N-acetylmuramoyl-L-alanine--D-glutamate ligase [Bacillota bacterium]